jgi:glycosyltransferase involved in cell wall biosynthesis
MACARPVILGVGGQARSILQEAHAGIAIEPENSAALVNAMRQLERGRETSRDLGRNGREYILRKYSRRHTAEKYIEVLEELLQLPKPQPTEAAA